MCIFFHIRIIAGYLWYFCKIVKIRVEAVLLLDSIVFKAELLNHFRQLRIALRDEMRKVNFLANEGIFWYIC